DAVALGSPHFSYEEFGRLEAALKGREITLPFYVCTGRHAVERLDAEGRLRPLEEAGVTLVTDTCVVVTPILPRDGGVLMTNSGKFAHYAPGTIGYGVVYGSLEDCVATAADGRVTRDESLWR
nr:aconitase X [Kiloniellales bacterium]